MNSPAATSAVEGDPMSMMLAEAVNAAALATFFLITIAYLGLTGLTVFVARHDFKLIEVGLLTAVAALAYGCLVFPGGPLLSPQLM